MWNGVVHGRPGQIGRFDRVGVNDHHHQGGDRAQRLDVPEHAHRFDARTARPRERRPMSVTVLGASGFIGQRLAAALRARGDNVVESSLRDPEAAAAASAGSDVVVNLAGSPVSVRWTPATKAALMSSRVDFAAPISWRRWRESPSDRGPTSAPPRSAITARAAARRSSRRARPATISWRSVCVAWEAEADTAATLGMRVAKLRTGLVLGSEAARWRKLFPIFRLGLGGPVGDGGQWYSWIHADDQVGITLQAIDGTDGVLNAVAPTPVTNREFSRTLGRVLHRPALPPDAGVRHPAAHGRGRDHRQRGPARAAASAPWQPATSSATPTSPRRWARCWPDRRGAAPGTKNVRSVATIFSPAGGGVLPSTMSDQQLSIRAIFEHATTTHARKHIVSRDGAGDRALHVRRVRPARRQARQRAAHAGRRPGDRVASFAWNGHRHLELYYAVPMIGAVLHTVNIRLFPDQAAFVLDHAGDRSSSSTARW